MKSIVNVKISLVKKCFLKNERKKINKFKYKAQLLL